MRRGGVAGEEDTGGAWECSAIMRAENSIPLDSWNVRTNPRVTDENEMPCTDDG
jgi:hypothetical protein